jgi:hypothetical protein
MISRQGWSWLCLVHCSYTFARSFEVLEKFHGRRYKRIQTTIRHEVVDCHSVQTTAYDRFTPLQIDLDFLERLDQLHEVRIV